MSTPEGQSFCSKCGKPFASDASFCRNCGARRAPGASAASPPPPPPAEEAPTQTIPAPQASPRVPPPPPPPPSPERKSGSWTKPVLLATLAGLLVGGAVAAAILLLGGDDSNSASGPAPGSAATVPVGETGGSSSGEATSGEATSGEADPAAGGEFPSEDRAQMASEIQSVLLAFHEDIVSERFRDAWRLQSARKRAQYLREQGYQQWLKNQRTLVPYLSPAGLTARVNGLEDEGVARVLLTGMGWSDPDASCSEWSGLTWVKYEGGAWAYDPGYSTTPEREQAWQPRYSELLGADC